MTPSDPSAVRAPALPAVAVEVPESEPVPRKRVLVRRGDGVFSADEYAHVDVEVAGQWDATQWHDRPPL